jgi:acyl carrier protein
MRPIVNSIQKLLKQKLNIYPTVLTSKTDLKRDLNLEDWELLYLLNSIEQVWGISITQNDAANMTNMEYLLAVVKKQVSAGTRIHQ